MSRYFCGLQTCLTGHAAATEAALKKMKKASMLAILGANLKQLQNGELAAIKSWLSHCECLLALPCELMMTPRMLGSIKAIAITSWDGKHVKETNKTRLFVYKSLWSRGANQSCDSTVKTFRGTLAGLMDLPVVTDRQLMEDCAKEQVIMFFSKHAFA